MKSIILLSAGLDSLVCLGLKKNSINLALTFDYGQKSAKKEIESSKKLCEYYNITHKVIKLDFLKEITNTSLVSKKTIPKMDIESLDKEEICKDSAKSVWVPNRNGLFLNVAASFCDSLGYDEIIIGANSEEAKTFSDNSKDFIESINETLKYSTQVHPTVVAPLINLNKNDIVKLALENSIPLNLVHSCYVSNGKNCGKCESCQRLKRALSENECYTLIKEIFEDEN